MARYPDAKVLLSVREPDKWYTSASDTLYAVHSASRGWLRHAPIFGRFSAMVDAVVWQGTFNGRFEDRAYALEVYNRHIETVKREVPAERLLVWTPQEGWAPLCAFLGVPVPNEPFPHLNDNAEFKRIVARVRFVSRAVPVLAAALLLAAGLAVWHFATR
jgi:hypothetical protein